MQEVSTVTTGSDVRCLGVHIKGQDEPVLVPLLTELPRKRFRSMTKAFAAVAAGTSDEDADELVDSFFKEYLGNDFVDSMNQREFVAMVKTWMEASRDEAGASVGE
jgi:hypothetical protein